MVVIGKEQNKVENEKISVVATIFPQYDFVRQIAGENVELKMLLNVTNTDCMFTTKPISNRMACTTTCAKAVRWETTRNG